MFDHANPSGFQHVFHFLLKILSKEKSSQEFRDCWPILDKKQEADFRRRVVAMIKEYQKDFPDELSYTNPSLFQQPGGRKYLNFLSIFSTFVLKCSVRNDADEILNKPSPTSQNIKKISLKLLVRQTQSVLEETVNGQEEIEGIENEAIEAIGSIMEKFNEHKKKLGEIPDEEEESPKDPDLTGKEEQIQDAEAGAKQLFKSIAESLDTIHFVAEGGVDKVQLDLNELHGLKKDGNPLSTIYQSLIKTVITTAEMAAAKKTSIVFDKNCNVETERQILSQLRNNLEETYKDLKENVDELQTASLAIVSIKANSLSTKGRRQ